MTNMYSLIQFADIDVKKLTLLTNYTEYEQKLLIEAAIKCILLFYIIFDSGKPIVLDNGDIERIRLNYPGKVNLNFQSTEEFENLLGQIPSIEQYSWSSLWVDKGCADLYLETSPKINKLCYSTPLLDALWIAVEKFWQNHDPNYPPKSETIINYLVNEHKLSIKNAKEIDSIIRPGVYKSGGNRRRN